MMLRLPRDAEQETLGESEERLGGVLLCPDLQALLLWVCRCQYRPTGLNVEG